jgi:hypothetical protein
VDELHDAERHDRPYDARHSRSRPAAHDLLSYASPVPRPLRSRSCTNTIIDLFHGLYTCYYDGAGGPGSPAGPRSLDTRAAKGYKRSIQKATTGTSKAAQPRRSEPGAVRSPARDAARRSSPSRRPKAKGQAIASPGVSRTGRVRPLQREGVYGTRREVWGCEAPGKRGGTARVFQAPVPAAVETYHGTTLPP